MRKVICILWVWVIVCWTHALVDAATLSSMSSGYSLEKEYGYFIGDIVTVLYSLSLPRDLYLREDSVPGEGANGDWVEVRAKRILKNENREMRVYQIELSYQVFFVSDTAKAFEIPHVQFAYGPRDTPSNESSAWGPVPITVSPLTSPDDQFQPPMMWSWNSSTPKVIGGAGALLLLAGLGTAIFFSAKKLRSHSPLGEEFKRLSREKDPRAALLILRSALNRKAGQAIFPNNLEDLFRVFPEARAGEKELLELVLLSEEASFNPGGFKPDETLHTRIAEAMKKMKRLERWG